jgi:amino acid transporter
LKKPYVNGLKTGAGNRTRTSPSKISVVPMIAATYFMVAGGPYGLEEVVEKTGYLATLLILVVTPLLWSLPTAMMVSELATAIPEEGGFYIWVRRGMGRFWGYQETWLTLAGSVFEMALYPNLCVAYASRFLPGLQSGHRGLFLGFAMIALCTGWNILGARSVGEGSVWLNIALLAPFVALIVLALGMGRGGMPASVPLRQVDLLGGVLIAMWNYMGWDNLSTIAGEVEAPQRTYSRAMFGAVVLVVVSYVLPVAAVARTGIDPNSWTAGGWADVARLIGGETLAVAIALAGVIGAIGSFSALMLSFTRLPLVMAEDGYLPRVVTRQHSLGRDHCMRRIVGRVLSAGIRKESRPRRPVDGPEHSARILGSGGAADSRTGTRAPISSTGRHNRRDCHRAASSRSNGYSRGAQPQ